MILCVSYCHSSILLNDLGNKKPAFFLESESVWFLIMNRLYYTECIPPGLNLWFFSGMSFSTGYVSAATSHRSDLVAFTKEPP